MAGRGTPGSWLMLRPALMVTHALHNTGSAIDISTVFVYVKPTLGPVHPPMVIAVGAKQPPSDARSRQARCRRLLRPYVRRVCRRAKNLGYTPWTAVRRGAEVYGVG